MFCPRCGMTIEKGCRVCPDCGCRLAGQDEDRMKKHRSYPQALEIPHFHVTEILPEKYARSAPFVETIRRVNKQADVQQEQSGMSGQDEMPEHSGQARQNEAPAEYDTEPEEAYENGDGRYMRSGSISRKGYILGVFAFSIAAILAMIVPFFGRGRERFHTKNAGSESVMQTEKGSGQNKAEASDPESVITIYSEEEEPEMTEAGTEAETAPAEEPSPEEETVPEEETAPEEKAAPAKPYEGLIRDQEGLDMIHSGHRIGTEQIRDIAVSSVSGTDGQALNLMDDFYETNWKESAEGSGTGEYVQFTFDAQYRVYALSFRMGNWNSEEEFYGSSRPASVDVALGSTLLTLTFPDEWQEFGVRLSEPAAASDIRVTIRDVYPGHSPDDTVITDIGVWYQ